MPTLGTGSVVVGGRNSSNSRRLVEAAVRAGCSARLIARPDELDPADFDDCQRIGLTGGASTPEDSILEVIDALRQRFDVSTEELGAAEMVRFRAASLAPLQ